MLATPDQYRHYLFKESGSSISAHDLQHLQSLLKERVASKPVYSVVQDTIQNLAFTVFIFDQKNLKKSQPSTWQFKQS
jgi:hypothetical protein